MIYWDKPTLRILLRFFGKHLRINLGRSSYLYWETADLSRHGIVKLWGGK